MQGLLPSVFAVALILAPLSARGADLVVWWEKGFYDQADEAVTEIIAAFEQDTGREVELVQPGHDEIFDEVQAAVAAGRPPDFLFAYYGERWIAQYAYEDRLADLAGPLGPVLNMFDADAVDASTLFNDSTGRRGLYALPIGRGSNHIHVWASLLAHAGFSIADIPKQWDAFWAFWCDRVQPAVRKALDRDDIWGVGLPMSAAANDTDAQLFQFQLAYDAPWIDRDRRLQIDDPTMRAGLVKALDDYTAIWRKGCTPPASISWANVDNNRAFLAQTVVMTANPSLSIPAALKRERPDDYYTNAVTIDWPDGADLRPLILGGFVQRAIVSKGGGNRALADDFVRFLAEEGWLAHWLTFMGDMFQPPMRKLVEQPFWLDPKDPHRMRAAIQILTQAHHMSSEVRDNERRSGRITDENVWGNAVHRVVTENISPEQAVDEAIARIKQILAE
jgi:multiple sugar transport system substrate-binding protein